MAELTIVMSRWPAVILAVSRTPSAMGRINRLTVSIKTMNGISGVGEPSGSMWANVEVVLVVRPVITVAIHIGIAMAMFTDSWEVGVNVYGSRPKRLDKRINMSRLVRKRAHFCPVGESRCTMFSRTVLKNQFMIVDMRLFKSVVLGRMKRMGMSTDSRLVGMNRISGLANCSNMFMFMVEFKWVLF